jgi:aerotaxis receptor
MRVNQPVTQREYPLEDGAVLMSTTDASSHVTYANEAFIDVSGFSREEVMGQPHNFVRHPDMPKEAFADMWATLKHGEPWSALVKNRRKNGDHYWVRANAVPVVRDGRQVGYMSVRTKPGKAEVEGAEALYRDFREGKAKGKRFHKGLILRTGPGAILDLGLTLSVRGRIRLVLGTLAVLGSAAALLGRGLTAGLPAAGLLAVMMILASLLLEQQIAKPIEQLRLTALAVATGASRDAAVLERVDEIGVTMRAISQLGLMFRWLVDDVREQVVSVQTSVTEIAQGNNDLSARTEQAAASVQQTASSMEEVTAAVQSNADAAQQANQLSKSASDAAERGGEAVTHAVTTMSDISTSSRRIADIISVIDGIAFQTNILALNAAVEAARAGEQGRGFAVVAGEVRLLAQRSAEAAREIKGLIGASVERVEAGSKIVDEAGRTMGEIVEQVKRVSTLIGDISSASIEQTSGIRQANEAVSQIDQITQQNAALVEQSTAASLGLKQRAESLVDAVSVFS